MTNPLGPILLTCVICVTLVVLLLVFTLRMVLKHFINSREADDLYKK